MNASVCHLSSVHSGVEIRIVRKELASLARAGYRARVVIPCTERDAAEMRTLGIEPTPLADPDGTRGRAARMTRLAARTLRMARRIDADLYHFHDPELIPVGLALKACGKRVVMDVHDDLAGQITVKHWIRPSVRRIVARLARALEFFGARRFDAVVTANPFLASVFRPVARRVEAVHNFPLLGELDLDATDVPWSARTQVAYIGGISRARGIQETIDALALAGAPLELAGRWHDPDEADAIRRRPGWRHVSELGYVGRPAIRDVLARSFAGLCTLHATPSHRNAEPIKLYEYMAAGIPVICSSIPGWAQVVEDAQCGLVVDPTSPQQIADAIAWLRDHPDAAQRMGANGRRAVRERFNWDREGDRLVALYRSILGR